MGNYLFPYFIWKFSRVFIHFYTEVNCIIVTEQITSANCIIVIEHIAAINCVVVIHCVIVIEKRTSVNCIIVTEWIIGVNNVIIILHIIAVIIIERTFCFFPTITLTPTQSYKVPIQHNLMFTIAFSKMAKTESGDWLIFLRLNHCTSMMSQRGTISILILYKFEAAFNVI